MVYREIKKIGVGSGDQATVYDIYYKSIELK